MNWNYNPGQNPFATNATARQNEAFSLPPPPPPSAPGVVLTLYIQVSFNTINTAWGGRGGGRRETVETGSHNNIPKLFQWVEYELI